MSSKLEKLEEYIVQTILYSAPSRILYDCSNHAKGRAYNARTQGEKEMYNDICNMLAAAGDYVQRHAEGRNHDRK